MENQLLQKLKKIKYIYSDIDGTIVDGKYQVSKETIWTVAQLVRQGYRFGLVSGRPPYMANNQIRALNPNLAYIGCNGNWIYDSLTDTTNFFQPLNREFMEEFWPMLFDTGFSFFAFTKDRVYYHLGYNRTAKSDLLWRFSMFDDTHSIVVELPNESLPDQTFSHLTICLGSNQFFIPPHFQRLSQRYAIKFFQGMDGCLEVNNLVNDKATGIKLALGEHVPMDQVLVFGDSYNDIPMLKAAGVSVAMANANADVKNFAQVVTEFKNTENGVAHFLCKYLLNSN